MSLHILDTDTLTLFQAGHAAICRRAKEHPQSELTITVISVEEQLSGWYTAIRKAKQVDNFAYVYGRLAQNVRFLSRLQIREFDQPAIRRYQTLVKLRLNVRKMDLGIAAIVLGSEATLVTRNTRDFKQIPGLSIVDWAA